MIWRIKLIYKFNYLEDKRVSKNTCKYFFLYSEDLFAN